MEHAISKGARQSVLGYLATAGVVLLLLMVFGLTMRTAQAGGLAIPAEIFYQLMTAHGIGMVGIAGMCGAAIMWYFLGQYVKLSTPVFLLNMVLFLIGVVMILGAIFIGGFAGAWTFLYPLPANSGGAWEASAAVVHLSGVLLIGVGFLLFHLDTGWAILKKYGSLGNALGWPQLFGNSTADAPPPTVVASTMVLIVNVLGLVSGAAILAISIVNLLVPEFGIDPLLGKNMIFFFGHVFINATIYMSVIAVYEILPRYTGRPWKSTKPFLFAWTCSTLFVVIVYPHHLLMDINMPTWMAVMGQVISYLSGIPVLLVTAFGALSYVHRSGLNWGMPASLLFLAVFGWAAGAIPAIVDGTIVVNLVLHNTQWVPGHFHTYLLLGVVPMAMGFMYYITQNDGSGIDRAALWAFIVGGFGFVFTFLWAGKESVPRRFAEHQPEWMGVDSLGATFAALTIVGVAIFAVRFLTRLGQTAKA